MQSEALLSRLGIKEVQIIQWFVQPEARVEQFDKICEVQSDKAVTEVTLTVDVLPNASG